MKYIRIIWLTIITMVRIEIVAIKWNSKYLLFLCIKNIFTLKICPVNIKIVL